MLSLNDRPITLTATDECVQIMLEKEIDNCLKNFDNKYIYNKIKNKLIQDGFIYRCGFVWV